MAGSVGNTPTVSSLIRTYATGRDVTVTYKNGYQYIGQLAYSYTSGDPIIHLRNVQVIDAEGDLLTMHAFSSLHTDHSLPIDEILIE